MLLLTHQSRHICQERVSFEDIMHCKTNAANNNKAQPHQVCRESRSLCEERGRRKEKNPCEIMPSPGLLRKHASWSTHPLPWNSFTRLGPALPSATLTQPHRTQRFHGSTCRYGWRRQSHRDLGDCWLPCCLVRRFSASVARLAHRSTRAECTVHMRVGACKYACDAYTWIYVSISPIDACLRVPAAQARP